MRKIFCALILLAIFAGFSGAKAMTRQVIKFGMITKLNTTEEQFAETWQKTFAPRNEDLSVIVKFYDNLTAMQMAMNAGEINQMVLPEPTAQYVLNQNSDCESVLVLRSKGMGLSFGFREDSSKLRDEFNTALKELRESWTLPAIEGMYISSSGAKEPEPVKFANFENAETIRIAVTGDLPPIDYIAPDGTPAGFNTAVLAEVAKFLHKNVKLVNIDSAARTAALASKRVDVVFWYEVDKTSEFQADIPDGVIISEPYYEWEKFIHVKKALKKTQSSQNWNINRSIMEMFFSW